MQIKENHLSRRAVLTSGCSVAATISVSAAVVPGAVVAEETPQSPGFALARQTADIAYAEGIETTFDQKICIHARQCLTRLSHVFRPLQEPWMTPEAERPEQVASVIDMCPSGALQYNRLDGGDQEAVPANIVSVRENGPLEVRGTLEIDGQAVGYRRALCRCGKSANKPYCDNSHENGFTADGVVAPREDPDHVAYKAWLSDTRGPLAITALPDGPYEVSGQVQICSGTGKMIACGTAFQLCRCGKSGDKPFCDGSHAA
jgi:CDGSH-type Zn-finger protein/uncharacterized Fe-S cluster protein YjdI